MINEALKNILAERKAQKNVKRVPVCSKVYQAFTLERHNLKVQAEERKVILVNQVIELNKIIKDFTFRFVIWDYDTFYSVQVLEGTQNKEDDCVVIGDRTHKMFESVPIHRKHFKTINGVNAYLIWYFNNFIRPESELLKRQSKHGNTGLELSYEIPTVELQSAKFKTSRAVIFTTEMMLEWQKTKLLPTIQKLFNGKRYNRTVHAPKIIAALEQGKIIKEQKHYVVYWTL